MKMRTRNAAVANFQQLQTELARTREDLFLEQFNSLKWETIANNLFRAFYVLDGEEAYIAQREAFRLFAKADK
jgi:hypothetical protein